MPKSVSNGFSTEQFQTPASIHCSAQGHKNRFDRDTEQMVNIWNVSLCLGCKMVVVCVWQDWALGVLHAKIIAAITLMGPQWWLKTVIEQVSLTAV